MDENHARLAQIAARATRLFSRPTVAMEVLELAERPQVDARAIKECVEKDPALTCKILRVVNSSLFGLRGEVADLNQAVALLGIKPLKLLVLGFSLPDELFAGVASQQLQWYWTSTLTRAVSARMISQQLWSQPGDEPFIAGLLQDIGILALLRELGPSYVKFLAGVIDEHGALSAVERETLGFDHTELSAAMLSAWHLPRRITDAIVLPKQTARLARLPAAEAELPQILHLADLFAQLIGQRRLAVLPDLLEAGNTYRGLTKPKLTELVAGLQPQVDQLADLLSLELTGDRDYLHVLFEAHEQMAELSEHFARRASEEATDADYADLLQQSQELVGVMQSYAGADESGDADDQPAKRWDRQHASHEPARADRATSIAYPEQSNGTLLLLRRLATAAEQCRECRQELSLLLVEPNNYDAVADPDAIIAVRTIRQAINDACASFDPRDVVMMPLPAGRTAVILLDCERRTAVEVAGQMISAIEPPGSQDQVSDGEIQLTASAGVATVSGVPKNFDPWCLWESAERCLHAAHRCGTSAVKSIEV
jgi:HD-like signal output (HDOD) protein